MELNPCSCHFSLFPFQKIVFAAYEKDTILPPDRQAVLRPKASSAPLFRGRLSEQKAVGKGRAELLRAMDHTFWGEFLDIILRCEYNRYSEKNKERLS